MLTIGERFKRYEASTQDLLVYRLPVIVRVDGRTFHTLTRKLKVEKPFSAPFADAMERVAIALCRDGHPVLAYHQSDEVSLCFLNDRTLDAGSWFEGNLQKIVSVSAGIASAVMARMLDTDAAMFDSRAFVLPHNDVVNYFLWRQRDALKNARQSWAEYTLGAKVGRGTARRRLHGVTSDVQVKLTERETGQRFADVAQRFRWGTTLFRSGTGYEVWGGLRYGEQRAEVIDYLQGLYEGDCGPEW